MRVFESACVRELNISKSVNFPSFTTAERDLLDANKGELIYNSTTDKLNLCTSDGIGAGHWISIEAGAGATDFTDLSDCPNAYNAGDAGKFVRVNSTEDGLEFTNRDLTVSTAAPWTVCDWINVNSSGMAHGEIAVGEWVRFTGNATDDADSYFVAWNLDNAGTFNGHMWAIQVSEAFEAVIIKTGEMVCKSSNDSADKAGSDAIYQASDGTGTDKDGGNVILRPGEKTGTGTAGVCVLEKEAVSPLFKTSTAPTANSTGTVAIVAKDANIATNNAGWLPMKKSDGTTIYLPYWT